MPPTESKPKKPFPVMLSRKERTKYPACPKAVPWEMVSPHERQALQNHRQSLARLAERGGLAPDELVAVLADQPYDMAAAQANHEQLFSRSVVELLERLRKFAAVSEQGAVKLHRAWQWQCRFCQMVNPAADDKEGKAPRLVECRFCRTVYTAITDDPTGKPADDGAHEQDKIPDQGSTSNPHRPQDRPPGAGGQGHDDADGRNPDAGHRPNPEAQAGDG